MAGETLFRDVRIESNDIRVRAIGLPDLWKSLREGYADFNAKPVSFGLFLGLIYPLFALSLSLFLVSDAALLYLAFPMLAGMTLLGPVVAVALCEMSRQREQGRDAGWRTAFEFVHSSSYAPIIALSLVMALLYVGWLFMAQLLYFGSVGQAAPSSASEFANLLLSTRAGAGLIFYGTLLGFLFAFAALAISVVAFPLALDKPVTSVTAMDVSVRAVTSNLLVMSVWGLVVVAMLTLGALTLFIGLAAVLPILGHATWHLYRKVVEP